MLFNVELCSRLYQNRQCNVHILYNLYLNGVLIVSLYKDSETQVN